MISHSRSDSMFLAYLFILDSSWLDRKKEKAELEALKKTGMSPLSYPNRGSSRSIEMKMEILQGEMVS
jgi:hypothetical protein